MPHLTLHTIDFAGHEQARLAAYLNAATDLDLVTAYTGEARAARMLYSGLDAAQRATYRVLREAGVLP